MRRLFLPLSLVFLLCAAAPHGASAFPGASDTSGADRFGDADSDASATLSREEFAAAFKEMRSGVFDMLDKDHDGFITRAEWNAFRQAHTGGAMGQMPGAEKKAPPRPEGSLPLLPMPTVSKNAGTGQGLEPAPTPLPESSPAAPAVPAPPAAENLPLLLPPASSTPPANTPGALPTVPDAPPVDSLPLLEPPKQ